MLDMREESREPGEKGKRKREKGKGKGKGKGERGKARGDEVPED
jgi:hypothetical protein